MSIANAGRYVLAACCTLLLGASTGDVMAANKPPSWQLSDATAIFAPAIKELLPLKGNYRWRKLPDDKLIIEVTVSAQATTGVIGPYSLGEIRLRMTPVGRSGGAPLEFPLLAIGTWARACNYIHSDDIPPGSSATVSLKSGDTFKVARGSRSSLQFSAKSEAVVLCMAFMAPKSASGTLQLRAFGIDSPVAWAASPIKSGSGQQH